MDDDNTQAARAHAAQAHVAQAHAAQAPAPPDHAAPDRSVEPSNIEPPTPLRILHVITRLILGGAQQNTVYCCKAQREAGHEVHLAFGPIQGPEGSLLDAARDSGATLHELPHMVRHVHPLTDLRGYRELRRLIRDLQPDIVHTHSSKAGIVARAAAWHERTSDNRPRIIHTIHGLPWTPADGRLKTRLYIALERWAAWRCDKIIAITPQMVDAFLEQRIGTPAQYTVIPSGVDVDMFRPFGEQRDTLGPRVRRELGIPDHAPVVGIVARFDPLKGYDDLLDILPDLRRSFPDLHYLFVGGGAEHERIAARIRDEGHGDHVVCTGLVPFDDVPRLLTAVDVHALPSYQEGQSRTLCEALLSGCAVVGYHVGGIPAIIEHDATGLLVPMGDKAALREAIERCLSDREEARRMTRAGAERVERDFAIASMTSQTAASYRSGQGGATT